MKKCSSCGDIKAFDLFQKRSASRDGLTSSCDSCLKIRDRARYINERSYRLERHKIYMLSEKGKQSHKESVEKWQANNKEKRAAHILLGSAIKQKKITKAPCAKCGELKVEAHHEDYSRPLDVTWLCQPHHKARHKEMVILGIDPLEII